MRRLLTLVLVAVAALSATATLPATADEALTYVHYANRNSGKCLGASGGGTANGTKVIQWTCNAANSDQMWAVDGYRQVVNKKSGKCLAVPGNSALGGVQLHLWTCDPRNPYLKWGRVDVGSGYHGFVNDYDDLTVAVAHGWSSDGVAVIQWPITGGYEQHWYVRSW